MGEQQLRVLLVESDVVQCRDLERSLTRANAYSVDAASDAAEAWELIAKPDISYDIVLLNDTLAPNAGEQPRSVGLELKERIENDCPDTQVAIYTGCGVDRGCDSLRAPDLRCLGRSFSSDQLASLVHQAAEKQRLRAALRQYKTLGRLMASSAVLLGGRSEDEVLKSILRDVQAIGFDRVRLYLLSEDGQYLVGRAYVGMDEGFLGETWPLADDEYMQTLIDSPRPYVFKREPGKPKHPETAIAKEGVGEWACVPLLLRGKVIGSLSADNKYTHRAIREDELVPVALFTSLATAAIENARLLKDAQHRAEQLELLRRTTLAIGAHLDRRTLLETIIREAVSLLGASSGSIFQYHPDRGELTIAANYLRPEEAGIVLKVGEGMAGRLVVNGLPHMIVDDYDNWEGRAAAYEGKRQFEAVVQVPLKSDGEIVGVLSVDAELPRRFTDEDARLLSQFSDHAAVTLNSAELAEKEAKKARRLQELSQISSEIVSDLSSMSLDERLDLVARRAAEVLEAEACGISLVKQPGFLSWEASYGHANGAFRKGRKFAVISERKGGLTGHIAKEGRMFNAWGSALANHWAVKGEERDHIASQNCRSLLALPLKNKNDELVGLLRVENKLGGDGTPGHRLHFTPDDELILNSFGQAVVVAIDAAALVDELKEKKDHLKRLVDSSPNGIISIDTDGKVTGFNQRAAEIQGYSAEEVTGWPVSRLYFPAEEPRKIGKRLHLSEDGKLTGYQTHVLSNNGERIPIRLSAIWLYDAKANRIGSVGYFEDLRSTKAAVRRHELLLKASNALAHAGSLADGLSRLAQLMVSVLHHSFCRILLVDESGLFLDTEAVYPSPSNKKLGWKPGLKTRIPITKWSELPMVLAQGTPVVRSFRDERVRDRLQAFSRQLGLREPIQSLLLVPLKIDNRLVGLLDLGELRSEELSKFTEEDIKLASAIAAQTTMLIERMRLLEQTRDSGEKLRELFEASNALVSDRDIQGTLEDIVERTRAAAEAGLVRVIIFDPTGEARIQAIAGTQFREFGLTDALRADGISMQVMEKGVARWIEDVSKETKGDVNSQYVEAGIKAAICFPLLRRGESMGVMWISYDQARYFSPEQKRDLQLYVNQAAIACGNAWRIDEMKRLHAAAEEMSRASDLPSVLRAIVEQAKGLFQADSSALSSYDDALGEFIPDRFVGIPESLLHEFKYEEPEEGGITHTVLENEKKYVAVPDVDNEQREFLRSSMRERLRLAGIGAFHGIALEDGDENLGVLYVSYKRPRRFTREDRRHLKDFATYAARAVKRARLLDQVEKAREAAGIVARVAAEGKIETILPSIAEEIRKGLRAHAVTLYACGGAGGYLQHLPGVAGLTHPEKALRYEMATPNRIVNTILGKEQPHTAENVEDDPVFQGSLFAGREGIRSCCGVRLKAKGRIVGAMFVSYRTQHRFTADDLSNIEMFANQAGVAIANTQFFEELGSKINEQEGHLRLSERLMDCTSVQEILDSAVAVATAVLGTDFSNIILPDKEGNLILSAAVGLLTEHVGKYQLAPGRESQTGYTIEANVAVISDDYSTETRFTPPPIAFETEVKSGLSVPIFRSGEAVGAMLVQSKTLRRFSETEVDFLSLIANQTAIAVQRLDLHQAAIRKGAEIKALYGASKAIASASRGLQRRQILDRIVEQAVKCVALGESAQAVFGTIQLFEQKKNELVFESVYPPKAFNNLAATFGLRRPLYKKLAPFGKIGVTGRTVLKKQPQLVQDVNNDPDYLVFNSDTKSELTVPLFDRDSLLGVLNVESEQLGAFDLHDVETLQALAELAAIAIKNAEQYEELKRTQGLVGARNALAWMGMTSNHWRHVIQGHAITIEDYVERIRCALGEKSNSRTRLQIDNSLSEILELARMIEKQPITAPLSSEEGVSSVQVNTLLRERINQILGDARYKQVTARFNLALNDSSTVRGNSDWLAKVLDVLVDNAVEAMKDSREKVLTVSSTDVGGLVGIEIRDTGSGVPDELKPLLFEKRVDKPKGSKGLGMGLLMAQCIAQAYGGEIQLGTSGPTGTAMIIRLPIEAEEKKHV